MTELIWDGKYDANGKKVAPLRVSLPFQTVKTVNESAQERQMALDLFSTGRKASKIVSQNVARRCAAGANRRLFAS